MLLPGICSVLLGLFLLNRSASACGEHLHSSVKGIITTTLFFLGCFIFIAGLMMLQIDKVVEKFPQLFY